ncbi:MAG: PqqD family protein [Patescibacteria group bacterium]
MINKGCFAAKGINVSCRMIDGLSYIYLEDKKQLLRLDEVGSFIWEQINGAKTVSEIIKTCLQEYEGDGKEIMESVRVFLETLLREKMIKISINKFKGVMRSV